MTATNTFKTLTTLFAITFSLFILSITAAQDNSIQTLLDDIRTENDITGLTLAIYAPDTGVRAFASGFADHDAETPLTTDDLLYAGSVTKTFVAATVLQLVDEGSLSLDDTLAAYYPDYPGANTITVQNLLGMTAGTFDYFRNAPDNPFIPVLMQDITYRWTPDEIIATAGSMDAPALPNTTYAYSNTDYILLGRVIEEVTDDTLHAQLRKRMFTPMDMNATFIAGYDDVAGDVAPGYVHGSAFLFGSEEPVVVQRDALSGLETLTWAAGGMISTASDLATGMYGIMSGDLLSEESLMAMKTPGAFAGANGEIYGLGVEFRQTSVGASLGHSGSIPGYASLTLYIPEHDLSIAVITNDESGEQYLPGLVNTVLDVAIAE